MNNELTPEEAKALLAQLYYAQEYVNHYMRTAHGSGNTSEFMRLGRALDDNLVLIEKLEDIK